MPLSNETLAGLIRGTSVHKSVYTDPDIFKLEMDRIYGRAWIYAGHESQVPQPGDYHTTRIGDQDVIMVRGADGAVNVLYNRCPHKGAKLVPDGDGSVGKMFRCPYHAWTYRLDGSHLSAPLRKGFENTGYDPRHPDFSMRPLARVDSYRGFVFVNQSPTGPDLKTFLGGAITSIDNLCDRSPVGEVEVAGGVFRVLQRSNWKVFYENLHDTMHAPVTHESSVVAAREEAAAVGEKPFELLIMDGNGEPYEFWEKLELRAYPNGHGYMEGIFDPTAADRDVVTKAHFATLIEAYGETRAREILGMNRHNTIIYGSGSPHTVFQQFRVIRPLSVDRTLVEIQVFRCKGAPDAVFDRAIVYANLINSPSSNVMPDDVEVYARCQEGNLTQGGDWISLHRYAGTDRQLADGMASTNGTSELPMRNQFAAWKQYMTGEFTQIQEPSMLLDRTFDVSTEPVAPFDGDEATRRSLEQFVFREARLLDDRDFDAWLALWTAEGMYWVPRFFKQQSPFGQISLFWEDKMLREVRVRRVTNERNWSQQPNTRTARLMGNIMVDGLDEAGNFIVHATFQLTEWRNTQRQLAGSCIYKLRREGGGWRIVLKRVDLVNSDDVFANLEVFI